jgi:hypothetical protein
LVSLWLHGSESLAEVGAHAHVHALQDVSVVATVDCTANMTQGRHQPDRRLSSKGFGDNPGIFIRVEERALPVDLRRYWGQDLCDKAPSFGLPKLARLKKFESFLVGLPRVKRGRLASATSGGQKKATSSVDQTNALNEGKSSQCGIWSANIWTTSFMR